jgi:preprotein translocase subunit SecE
VPVQQTPEASEVPAGGKKFNNMNKITTYFRESYRELLEKVTWPSWTQLQQSTVIVLVATLLITVIVGLMDLVIRLLMNLIYSFFGA